VDDNDPHRGHGRVWEGDTACVGVSNGMVEVKILCFMWLSHLPKTQTLPYLPDRRRHTCVWSHSCVQNRHL